MPGRRDQMLRTMLLCALTAAIFFLPFYIIDGGFFHYAGDFNSQQISFYRYMNGFIKGAGYPQHLLLGHRPGQRRDERLLILPVRFALLLAVPHLPPELAALPHGAAAGAEICRGGRRRLPLPLPLCPPLRSRGAGRLPVCLLGFQHLQCLLQPLYRRGGPLPVDALGAGRNALRAGRALRPLRVLGGGQPAQQLLLFHRPGPLPRHLLHLQADDERFPDECPPLRPAGV